LKRDDRLIQIVRSLRKIHPSRRAKTLEEFWERICEDPLVHSQDEYISWMGQRLSWHVSLSAEMEPEERPVRQVIQIHVGSGVTGMGAQV
jgi:hypothetical protein